MAVDWEKIELDYRAGLKSLREIASSHDISHVAIAKRAKRDKWDRDLSARIKAKAQALVNKRAVANSVNKNTIATENDVIEANALAISDVILAHKTRIPKYRELATKLFAEIEAMTDGKDMLEQLTLSLQQGDQDKLAGIARKVASLPGRIKGFSEMVGAYKILIGMERQAFNIDDTPGDGDDLVSCLKGIFQRIDGKTCGLPGEQ